jgi:hypothetical protein
MDDPLTALKSLGYFFSKQAVGVGDNAEVGDLCGVWRDRQDAVVVLKEAVFGWAAETFD